MILEEAKNIKHSSCFRGWIIVESGKGYILRLHIKGKPPIDMNKYGMQYECSCAGIVGASFQPQRAMRALYRAFELGLGKMLDPLHHLKQKAALN